jgi:hypothetical protein
MMLKLSHGPSERFQYPTTEQLRYQVSYNNHEGYLILSTNTLLVTQCNTGFNTQNAVLELPYETIVMITIDAPQKLVLTNNEHRRYTILSCTEAAATEIAENIKTMIVPLDYPLLG